ncbi:MAG TPA: MBL fold metallo-hydrolase [Vicinamibacterales bacterium]|nr:MBL fold metallo-hydrolase [Vicinamibacterales bacterium]
MMLVRRFYDIKLAQASYLVGALDTGEAVVIDANRDIDQYVRAAAEEGVRVTHVTETHIHADYLSGSRELAAETGATLLLSDEGGPGWRYAFAEESRAVLLKDGDSFDVGSVRIDVMHTPGHTPEHLTFLVTDTQAATEPLAALTGDFIFVGDVGRPDLLERAARMAGTMDAAARTLFHSVQRFKKLPDFIQIWPGHGAGSACGKALGAVPQTTLGYERRFNWAFKVADEQSFVDQVLAGQPDPPRYFAEMKRLNRTGPQRLSDVPAPPHLPAEALDRLLATGALVIDTRSADDFAAGHVPGTINIALNKAFTTWAGWLVPYTSDFYVIADGVDATTLDETRKDLAMIGLDRLAGYFFWDDLVARRQDLETTAQIDVEELATRVRAKTVHVLDVRSDAEWREGHIAGAQHIPLGELRDRIAEVPNDRTIAVHCMGGTRSAIAASLLQAEGLPHTVNFAGGFNAWHAAGLTSGSAATAG